MKKIILGMTAVFAFALLNGCGGAKADENRPAEKIRQEASEMGVSRLEKTLKNYDAAIAAKTAQLRQKEEKLSRIPVEQQFSEETKKLHDAADRDRASLFRLRANRQFYADALQNRAKK